MGALGPRSERSRRQHKGGTYDATSYVVAAHMGAIPAFHQQNIISHDELGMGLAEQKALASSTMEFRG